MLKDALEAPSVEVERTEIKKKLVKIAKSRIALIQAYAVSCVLPIRPYSSLAVV
jgi:hypothetical protein